MSHEPDPARRPRTGGRPRARGRRVAAATRYNLFGPFRLLEGEDELAFQRLRRAWYARLVPVDRFERAAVDAIAADGWRRQRLDILEVRLLTALLEGHPVDDLPSLDAVLRYRARLDRELERAYELLWYLQAPRAQRGVGEMPDTRRPIRLDPPPELGAAASAGSAAARPPEDEAEEVDERGVVIPFRPRLH